MVMERVFGYIFGVILFLTLPFFIFFSVLFILGSFEVYIMEDFQNLLIDSAAGWTLLFMPGVISLISIIMVFIAWLIYVKWKDLRYKMAFYLYHSKVRYGDRIPLSHLAKVAVCSVPEIVRTLELMIDRKELKGEVSRAEGVYIHKGLTRRGLRFLKALPPAKLNQLKSAQKWALDGHVWAGERDGIEHDIPELEEVEREELPPIEISKKLERKKVPCPHCGRMNIADHHFCTYCGEVI
ncbi:MAG: hypothetical protein ACMUIE_02345 [Thermoplasmatota archaeon]